MDQGRHGAAEGHAHEGHPRHPRELQAGRPRAGAAGLSAPGGPIGRAARGPTGVRADAGMWALFLLLFVLLSLTVPNFCTRVNLVALALSVSTVGIVACTMLFFMASGDFDLSVEAIVTFSGILAAVVMNRTGSIGPGIACGVLAGGLVGLVNGVIIAKIGINALIATLASLQIVRGLSFIVSDGSAVSITLTPFF